MTPMYWPKDDEALDEWLRQENWDEATCAKHGHPDCGDGACVCGRVDYDLDYEFEECYP